VNEGGALGEEAMSKEPRIVYRSYPDLVPEQEKAVLASVYHFLLECHATRQATARRSHTELEGGVHGTLTKKLDEKLLVQGEANSSL
jgi:hypothetical protein